MSDRTITTPAVGRASAPPDEVDLEFAVSAEEPDVTGARRAVAEQASRLREVLDATGVPGDHIRTSRFTLRQRSDPRHEGDPADRPFQAIEGISVTLHDLERVGAVISTAVDDAGVEINEVGFTFRTETRRDLQREAIADAVATARKKAEAAAAAEDLTVAGVRSMMTDEGSRPRQTGSGRALSMDTAGSGSLESGPIDVTVTVEVEYLLAEE